MRSMKAYMPVLLVGLLTCMTGTLAAQNNKMSFDGPLGWYNPCVQGTAAMASGTTYLDFHQNGSHISVHVRYRGTGENYSLSNWQPTGQDYKVNFEANGQFDLTPGTTSISVPFHAVWVGQGSAPNFSMDGTDVVTFDPSTGKPNGSHVTSDGLTTSCTN